MKIERVAMRKLKAAAYNPRVDLRPGDREYEKLRKSIEAFDTVDPIVWNRTTGNVVGGHQRLKVLKARGDTHAEVSVVELDEKREKALNLALNKVQGAWDFEKLAGMLRDFGTDDLEAAGFDASEKEAIMTFDPDSVPRVEDVEIRGDGGERKKVFVTFEFPDEPSLAAALGRGGLEAGREAYGGVEFEERVRAGNGAQTRAKGSRPRRRRGE